MKKLNLLNKYLKYYLKADSRFGIHSPFVYDFVTKVLNDRESHDAYQQIKAFRQAMQHSNELVGGADFGAGSSIAKSARQRKVAEIAKNTGHAFKYQKLLYRIVKFYKPRRILELGTSLGGSSLIFSLANPSADIMTIEGNPAIAGIARKNLELFGLSNVQVHEGTFEEVLPGLLTRQKEIDFVFFDGHHQKAPTLKYFKMCLQKINNNSIFLFDDINWSEGMQQAWTEIKADPAVSVSMDLFMMGLVFFRKESTKQDFVIRY